MSRSWTRGRKSGLKIPVDTKPARSAVHPIAVVAFIPPENPLPDSQSQLHAACFDLKANLERLGGRSVFSACLKIAVYTVVVDLLERVVVDLLERISVPLDQPVAAGGNRNQRFSNQSRRLLDKSLIRKELERTEQKLLRLRCRSMSPQKKFASYFVKEKQQRMIPAYEEDLYIGQYIDMNDFKILVDFQDGVKIFHGTIRFSSKRIRNVLFIRLTKEETHLVIIFDLLYNIFYV